MLEDVKNFREQTKPLARQPRAVMHRRNFMDALEILSPGTIDLVLTSPPYLNNYHYVRNTRPQIHWLGLFEPSLMETLERQNIGKFWQTVRDQPPISLKFAMPEIQSLIDEIRTRNRERKIYGARVGRTTQRLITTIPSISCGYLKKF